MLEPEEFFALESFEHREIFTAGEFVWSALDRLQDYLESLFEQRWALANITGHMDRPLVIFEGQAREDLEVKSTGPNDTIQAFKDGQILKGASIILPGAYLSNDRILIGSDSIIEPGALVKGPVVIGSNTEIRQGAYVRGDCVIGNGCVVGHTTEVKGSVMLNGAKAGHFAYIGDSILGNEVNLGAGTKLANLKMIPGTVTVRSGKELVDTGRRKIGAILGDRTETGCNSVTSPGTLMGPTSIVYPGVAVPAGHYGKRTVVMPSKGSLKIHTLKTRD
jgi:bifunctional N-acetylglucosamine-1-phosphate-uridyltransferase/glucosamine-1-phosphate-acetyltransferase GlmU-like protein